MVKRKAADKQSATKATNQAGGKDGASKGTGGRVEKKTVAESTWLNDEKVTSGTFNDAEKSEMELDKKLLAAFIGYARYDVLTDTDKMKFKHWNDRDLVAGQVSALMRSFTVDGVNRFKASNAIPLVISKKHLLPDSYGSDGNAMDGLTEMKLTDEATKLQASGKPVIYVASGQHRIEALRQYQLFLTKMKAESLRTRKRLEKTSVDDVDKMDIDDENMIAKPKRDVIDGSLAFKGQWMVAIYNYDIIGQEYPLGLHLARNQFQHVYKESAEEAIIQKFRSILTENHPKKWRSIDALPLSKGNDYKRNDLFRMDYGWIFLEKFIPMGSQIIDRKGDMKIAPLHATMSGPSGGALVYFCQVMEDKLLMCFNTMELEKDKINDLVSSYDDKEESKAELNKIYDRLSKATPVPSGIINIIRDHVDSAFIDHLGPNTQASHEFGQACSQTWTKGMASYTDVLITTVSQTIDQLIKSGDLSKIDISEDARLSIKNCCLKMKVVLTYSPIDITTASSLPFMSRTVYSFIVKRLAMIPDALKEISIWFSPYLPYKDCHPPTWNPGSETAELRRAIYAHPDLKSNKREVFLDQVMLSIWEHFPAYINLQLQIKRMNIPARPKGSSMLQALFGISQSKTPNDKKGKKKGKTKGTVTNQEVDENDGGDEAQESSDEEEDTDDDEQLDREERAVRREESIKKKKELSDQCAEVILILKSASKFKEDSRSSQLDPRTNFADITQPWTRASKLVGESIDNARFPGKYTFRFHTAEYSAINASSYYRHMPTLASMILAEASAVLSYRVALILHQPNGGAAYLRWLFENLSKDHLHTPKQKAPALAQTQLRKSKTPKWKPQDYTDTPPGSITWPDGIYNPSYSPCSFDAEEEMSEYHRDTKMGNQERTVQRVLDSIATIPCAWADATGSLKARDKPPLHQDLIPCLERLAKILNENAYVQRMYPHDDDFDPANADLEGEKLRVNIPGQTSSKTRILSLHFMETRPFHVYTRKEAEEHLEALRAAYLLASAPDGSQVPNHSQDVGPSAGIPSGGLQLAVPVQQSVHQDVPTPISHPGVGISDDELEPALDDVAAKIKDKEGFSIPPHPSDHSPSKRNASHSISSVDESGIRTKSIAKRPRSKAPQQANISEQTEAASSSAQPGTRAKTRSKSARSGGSEQSPYLPGH